MSNSELLHILALQQIPNIGSTYAKKLIAHCGSAEGVFKEKKSNLLKIDGLGEWALKGLGDSSYFDLAYEELKFINDEAIQCHDFREDSYPAHLKHCIDGPVVLFSKGNISLAHKRIISIVGARMCTSYGVSFCQKLVETLEVYNPVVVSGFAYGIDIAAHKACIEHNLQTVACLAHGLNQIYPKSHKKYVASIEANGGFYTDFLSFDDFDRKNFLKRNRIIAGMSEATIIIESASKGGSLVTADIANSYDREVFAVPGRANDTQSEGCNNLIKTQQAHLLSDPADIPFMLGWELEEDQRNSYQKSLFVELDAEEKMIFNYLKDHPKEHLDVISINCKKPTYKMASILLNMELKGVVRPLPGKLFELVSLPLSKGY